MNRITCLAALALPIAAPLAAQDAAEAPTATTEDTVFDGDWLGVGIGVAYSPSYDGSDDYVASVLPFVQGSIQGVAIQPRAGGVALDFVPAPDSGVDLNLGVTARYRGNRASRIKDPVVASLGELDKAIEVGPTVGASIGGVLNPYDSLGLYIDTRWDLAVAHGGMVVDPAISYFTPLSRGAFAALTLSAEHADGKFADYYYSIDAADAAISGLPQFDAGSGFTKASATFLFGLDLDGDATNGGLGLIGIAGYSRMLGDAKRSPFTSVRGDADQWFVSAGIGYTF
jgi:outer membrane scaffolding protein for murein synthesis (MipA/OmpV family)